MRVLSALAALGASLAIVACGSPSGPSGSGNLRLMITDAPFDDASAVHVTFSRVEAHADDTDQWLTVPFAGSPAATTRTCNLKKLQGPQDILGAASFNAGHYTQLRLIVSGATIYFGGDATQEPACLPTLAPPTGTGVSSQDMEIPSGEVKLNRPFELASNGTTISNSILMATGRLR